jgi:hypothetical protein
MLVGEVMPRITGATNKTARELKTDKVIADLKYQKKVQADVIKEQAEEIRRLKKR